MLDCSGSAHLNPSGCHGASAFLGYDPSNLVTGKQLKVLALRHCAVVVLGRGPRNGLWVEVMRAEIPSDGVSVSLVSCHIDIEFADGLHKIL
jgi:hypothetical protein